MYVAIHLTLAFPLRLATMVFEQAQIHLCYSFGSKIYISKSKQHFFNQVKLSSLYDISRITLASCLHSCHACHTLPLSRRESESHCGNPCFTRHCEESSTRQSMPLFQNQKPKMDYHAALAKVRLCVMTSATAFSLAKVRLRVMTPVVMRHSEQSATPSISRDPCLSCQRPKTRNYSSPFD